LHQIRFKISDQLLIFGHAQVRVFGAGLPPTLKSAARLLIGST